MSLGGIREPARPAPIIELPPYQRADVECEARFRWNCWARQTGKSFTKSLRRILRGLARRRTQLFLSAGERQCRELMLKARQHCEALKIAADWHDEGWFGDLSMRQLEITLPGGVRIVGLPANPLTVRGYTGDVLLDEFAMHTADREIWAAMLPTVLRHDAEVDIASTPRGKSNVFYDLQGNDRFSKSYLTLPQATAQGLRADAEEIRRALGDEQLYRQEFLCEFLDGSTAFLTYGQIAACVDGELRLCASPAELVGVPGRLFAGVDVGRLHDLTVIWVLAAQGPVLTTAAVFDMAEAPFREQFDRLAAVLRNRRVVRCCMDAGGLGMQLAEQTVERFGAHRVEAVAFTPAMKSRIAAGLRLAVEEQRIRIPDDQGIRNDWHSVERAYTASGQLRIAAPRTAGGHADRFWAAALAVHAAEDDGGPIEAIAARPLGFARPGAW
ncbi:MAG: hypothetical protein HY763_15740 [Planctomycetes bacterium]|nr:hypothetical protein [Planctomycetota bacterium]